ncbi:MAG: endonuclease Q family protein [archaeon]
MNKNYMIADLHIHSRFSRACSKDITIENLVKWARIKGLNLLGTGDFTHPVWFKEIREKLKGNENGFYYYSDFPFVISGEVSLMYTQERGRRIHLVILVPSIEIAEKINFYIDNGIKARRDYDGRPIFNISGEKFTEDLKKISEDIEIIPAHVWTPWFGVFGSNSGFDSLKECFGRQFDKIYAIETGMSSDPAMNWRIKEITENNKSIVSFSDSHSFWPYRLGREATIFKKTDSYKELIRQIRENDFIGTIEVDPAYGKYHWDGHRNCNFSCCPEESSGLNEICPECKKHLTIGVENRVEKLAGNPKGFKPENPKNYSVLLPLHEIIILAVGGGLQSKKVWEVYNNLIEKFENEFNVLIDVSKEELAELKIDEKLIDLILRNRKGKIKVKPGFDGEYGVAQLEEEQKKLF